MTLREKLEELVKEQTILHYDLKEQVPTIDGDTKSRLADKLSIFFTDGKVLSLNTNCSGVLENTSLGLE